MPKMYGEGNDAVDLCDWCANHSLNAEPVPVWFHTGGKYCASCLEDLVRSEDGQEEERERQVALLFLASRIPS